MKIPEGHTEATIISIIKQAVAKLAKRSTFGIYDADDIFQEAWLIANNVLEKYHHSIPLEAFLYLHIKSKLKNLKRDNFYRSSLKCDACDTFNSECTSCQRREDTETRKKYLYTAIDIDRVNPEYESGMMIGDTTTDVDTQEINNLINIHLPIEDREDYLKYKEGVYLNKSRRIEIEQLVMSIVGEYLDD